MRIRTILAAASVPAALAAALLGTAGAASAATTPAPAAATAAAVQAPVIAVTRQHGLTDTTSVSGSGTVPSDNGPVWAYDDITRVITVTPDKAAGTGVWTVKFAEGGVYNAIANPLTGVAWQHNGLFGGTITYQVTSTGTPKAASLPGTVPAAMGHAAIIGQLFGGSAVITGGGSYSFTYLGIPGAPGGVYTQAG